MRLVSSLFAALALCAPAAAHDDPRALVEAIYAPYLSGADHADLSQFYSAALKELFAQAEAAHVEPTTHENEPLSSGFNPFIESENALLFDLKIGEPLVLGDAALVTVGFHNFDHPSLLSLSLKREADGWKVDDVTSTGSDANWMLSWLLLYDPWSGP